MLDAELRPDGYNIGINDGAAAGQTVMHVLERQRQMSAPPGDRGRLDFLRQVP